MKKLKKSINSKLRTLNLFYIVIIYNKKIIY